MNVSRRAWLASAGALPLTAAAGDPALMLDLPGTGRDPERINFKTLPVLGGEHGIVSHGNAPWPFRNHNYVTHFDGRYWCMWSHGLRQEDFPHQHVQYATSTDGILWTEARPITGPSPRQHFRYIARGFWTHNGWLLALASHDEAYDAKGVKRLFGPSLELLAFVWNAATEKWEPRGVVQPDAINNFPPHALAGGEWMMICRDHGNNLSTLRGAARSPLDWSRTPLQRYDAIPGYRPDEPALLTLPDGRLACLFRDNARSQRIFRAVSVDQGRTWSTPVKTNFPDASSKLFPLRLSGGGYVLVSNANPAPLQRMPLCLAYSRDGWTFTRLARLPVPESPADSLPREGPRRAAGFQYPNAVEQDGHLLIVYSRDMKTVESIRVPLAEIDKLQEPRA